MSKQVVGLGAAIGFGLFVIAVYSTNTEDGMATLAIALMLAGAASLTGALLGFLFGIPRVLADTLANERPDWGRPTTRIGANTNLEQVSDWLTKLLLGAGLVQLGALSRSGSRFVDSIAPALGSPPTNVPFTGALLVYFTIAGFVFGWLTTRLMLGPALSHADQRALDRFVLAELAEESGDVMRASALREQAIGDLREANAAARRYDEVRQLPAGALRTSEMENIVTSARHSATSTQWTVDQVDSLFEQGNSGGRIFAIGLMQGDVSLARFSAMLEAVSNSRSAFEQYQGLRLARMILDGLSNGERTALRRAITQQVEPGGWIRAGGARWSVAQQILRMLDVAGDPTGGPASDPRPTEARPR
jgi:hypothetical protein